MATKHSADVPATTQTDLTGGGLAAGSVGTYLLTLCNRTAADLTFRVAVATGGSVSSADYIEYDAVIEANGVLSRWPIPLASGWKVFVYASGTGLSASLIGLERA